MINMSEGGITSAEALHSLDLKALDLSSLVTPDCILPPTDDRKTWRISTHGRRLSQQIFSHLETKEKSHLLEQGITDEKEVLSHLILDIEERSSVLSRQVKKVAFKNDPRVRAELAILKSLRATATYKLSLVEIGLNQILPQVKEDDDTTKVQLPTITQVAETKRQQSSERRPNPFEIVMAATEYNLSKFGLEDSQQPKVDQGSTPIAKTPSEVAITADSPEVLDDSSVLFQDTTANRISDLEDKVADSTRDSLQRIAQSLGLQTSQVTEFVQKVSGQARNRVLASFEETVTTLKSKSRGWANQVRGLLTGRKTRERNFFRVPALGLLVIAFLVTAGVLTPGQVRAAAVENARESVKQVIMSSDDANFKAAVAQIEDQSGAEQFSSSAKFAVALITGQGASGYMGDAAVEPLPSAESLSALATATVPVQISQDTDASSSITETAPAHAAIENFSSSAVVSKGLYEKYAGIVNADTAKAFLRELRMENLNVVDEVNPQTKVRTISYKLPGAFTEDEAKLKLIRGFLGLNNPNDEGQTMPADTVAVVVHFPATARAAAGPFVWVGDKSYVPQAYGGQTLVDAYNHFNYPKHLLGEFFIQATISGHSFRPTDKVGSVNYVGPELQTGAIRQGALFLTIDGQGMWHLAEYPTMDVNSSDSVINLIFSFTQIGPDGKRVFVIPENLFSQQAARANVEGSNFSTDSAGPSPFFRYDQSTGQGDIVLFGPNAFVYGPSLFADVALNAPMPDGASPDLDNLLMGAGDLAFQRRATTGLMTGDYVGSLGEGGAANNGWDDNFNITSMKNNTGLYIGVDITTQ